MTPGTKYARSGDVSIAYQVSGDGPVDVVWAPGTVSHLDLDWEWPPKVRFFEKFSSFCRLIRFDKRGTGLSDRPTNAATLEERTDDIRAVMDAVGSERAAIYGHSEGANMGCVFAATYPHRTRSLILYGAQARWVRTKDYPWGSTSDEYERYIEHCAATWPSREYFNGLHAGVRQQYDDPELLHWWMRYAQASASPAALVALERMCMQIDTRDILQLIRVPTLVINRTGDPEANVEAARDMAAHIPGARFIEVPGDTHWLYDLEWEHILEVVEEFVTGTRSAPVTDRVLATVLFSDIVGSTERAVELGDAAWHDLLNRYYGLVRKELAHFRGLEIDTAGDGFFATFDGPARAIQCALSIRDQVRQLGFQVRSGLHAGECELMANKVSGVAVHIGARVMAGAAADEIFVSSTVKDLVAGSGILFEDRGMHTLKGIPDEWHLYKVADQGPQRATV